MNLNNKEKGIIGLISLMRALFFVAFVVIVGQIFEIGTARSALFTAAVVGVLLGSALAFSVLNYRGFLLTLTLPLICYQLVFRAIDSWGIAGSSFGPYDLMLHCNTLFFVFGLSSFSTFVFWRSKHCITVELIGLTLLFVALLSGHRNLHFDTPSIINTLAWGFGVGNLSMLITLGVVSVILIWSYAYFATVPGRPVPGSTERVLTYSGGQHILIISSFFLSLALLLTLVGSVFYAQFAAIDLAMFGSGVGEKNDQGLSPLTFQSALGSTNQPAALVRLEGDYKENPFAPMLYLRETALSEFNGHELVVASSGFDSDLPRIGPNQNYTGTERVDLTDRTPLVQSIFLLAKHDNAFGVDYPISINPTKNPNPGRFKGTYKVYSQAPAYSLSQSDDVFLGDPKWSDTTRGHYLSPHPDPRYQALAEEITKGVTSPLDRAFAISTFLSKTSIYTLTPNHTVKADEDPVAPFLFGDHRGYCVHFAHASVYLLRALGIPARIATGYLTDLRQSKDGHILLRMSDRHAWAEVYLAGKGWIPFDVQPEQVENHAETQVDMKLLEDLIGMLGPSEDILPKDVAKEDKDILREDPFKLPRLESLAYPALYGLLLLALLKLYTRYSWILPCNFSAKVRRVYRSSASSLHDLGIKRMFGETREEFRARAGQLLGVDALNSTQVINRLRYSSTKSSKLFTVQSQRLLQQDLTAKARLSLIQRLISILNPASVMHFLSRRGW